jgi:hypothetical protein
VEEKHHAGRHTGWLMKRALTLSWKISSWAAVVAYSIFLALGLR